jgi:hypothetical protein
MAKLNVSKLEYEAILRANRVALAPMKTDGTRGQAPDRGSFTSRRDMRQVAAGMRINMELKKTASTSFNVNILQCFGCGGHDEHLIWKPKGSNAPIQREVLVLADQSYPALLPTSGEQRCIRLIRVEHGSIESLGQELASLAKGMELAKGSVVLIHSLSHMSRAGTSGYIEDFLRESSLIKSRLGQHLLVAPAPPLFLAGCDCPETIRSCAEVCSWDMALFAGSDHFLSDSYKEAMKLLIPDSNADCQVDYVKKLHLPTNTDWLMIKTAWTMQGFRLVKEIKPTSSGREATVILQIISELRKKLALNISESPSFERDRVVQFEMRTDSNTTYLMVGGPMAASLAVAMTKQGIEAQSVVVQECRVNSCNVTTLVEKTKVAVGDYKPSTIILVGLENSIYQAQTEDGYSMPIRKTVAGDYHVVGELIVCNKEVQVKHFKNLEPMWTLDENIKLVVVCPLLQYIAGSCCEDADHIPNKGNQNYESKLRSDLEALKIYLKMYLHTGGHHFCRVMDPLVNLKEMKTEEIWEKDPTMPTEAALGRMAGGIHAVEVRLKHKRQLSVDKVQPTAKVARVGSADRQRTVTLGGHVAGGSTRTSG